MRCPYQSLLSCWFNDIASGFTLTLFEMRSPLSVCLPSGVYTPKAYITFTYNQLHLAIHTSQAYSLPDLFFVFFLPYFLGFISTALIQTICCPYCEWRVKLWHQMNKREYIYIYKEIYKLNKKKSVFEKKKAWNLNTNVHFI